MAPPKADSKLDPAAALANLPDRLAPLHAELLAAMTQQKDPHGEWDKDANDAIMPAYAPAAIGKLVIPALHPMLVQRSIAYLWKHRMERNHKIVLGRASAAQGKVKYFGDVDFIIDINYEAWQKLTPRERIALIDHELTHCAVNGDTAKPMMVPHDIEEFGSIVKRWGLWQPDLEQFARICVSASQIALFEGDDAPKPQRVPQRARVADASVPVVSGQQPSPLSLAN